MMIYAYLVRYTSLSTSEQLKVTQTMTALVSRRYVNAENIVSPTYLEFKFRLDLVGTAPNQKHTLFRPAQIHP